METVLINRDTLQALLDYVSDMESTHYKEWVDGGNAPEAHVYELVQELQDCINAQ